MFRKLDLSGNYTVTLTARFYENDSVSYAWEETQQT